MALPGARRQSERPVFLVDGARTPFLKALAGPGFFSSIDLTIAAGRALLQRQPFAPEEVDQVIMGCVMPGIEESNIARLAALRLGCGETTPAFTVQRNCASGMQAADCALRAIQRGDSELVLAGGVETMSHAPLHLSREMVTWIGQWNSSRTVPARLRMLGRLRPQFLKPVIALLRGLTDPIVGLSMGQTAEIIARRFAITRTQADEFAAASHHRALAAQQEDHFGEIVPLFDDAGNFIAQDTGVRSDSTVDRLARLRPAFDPEFGTVTAGNSSQISDGAALLLLASENAVSRWNLTPLARIVDVQWAALDPREMGLGPVFATTPLLHRHKLALRNIDYWEINEAFAAQVLACLAAWRDASYCKQHFGAEAVTGEIATERLNVDGGAIALGHPVGATGARLLLHVARVLQRQQTKRGVATLCIGGGQGGAALLERD
ncbi:MAG: acetyl-CoA C-acetyltransferase [Gammaproteobacteria bacterium]|nr:acetyl-CoA C-acetyltransferase [Gammaproteobacteria bacterium]